MMTKDEARNASFYHNPGHHTDDYMLALDRDYLVRLLKRYDTEIERRAELAGKSLYLFMHEAIHNDPL